MTLLKGLGDFFALDIGTTAIRVVQLSQSASGNWSLSHYGYAAVDERVTSSNSAEGLRRLGEIIMTAIGQSGIKTKNVVIGMPSNKTFTTIIDVPNMPENELKNSIKYQIEAGSQSISISNCIPGIYTYNIDNKNSRLKSGKIVLY